MADENVEFRLNATDRTGEAFDAVERGLKGLGDHLLNVRGLMNTLAGTLTVDAFVNLVTGSIEAQAHMADLARMAGTTVETISSFEEPARTSGTALDTVAQSVARLSKSIGEAKTGDASKAALFKALGIDPADGRDAAEVMVDIARSLTHMTDQDVAAKVANDLLGKSFAEVRNFMAEVTQQGTLTSTVTSAQAARAKELADAYARLKLEGDLYRRDLTEAMTPALMDIAAAFAESKRSGSEFAELGEILGTMLKGAASLGLAAADVFYGLGHTVAGAAAAVSLVAHGELRAAVGAWNEASDDVARHTEDTNKRIARVWDEGATHALTVAQAQQQAFEAAFNVKGGASSGEAEAAVRARLAFEKNYTALLAAAQAGATQFAETVKLRNALAQAAYQEGEISQKEFVRQSAANEDALLAAKIGAMQAELKLAQQKGDKEREQTLKNGIAAAQAEREAQALIARVKVAAAAEAERDEDRAFKQKLAKDMQRIRQENLTERERLEQDYADRLTIIENAQANELISAQEAAQQRELVELQHQAALGNLVAQGLMQRRQLEQMNWLQQSQFYFGQLAAITAAGAQHNKTMFNLNKAANIANAIMSAYTGATKALEWGWPLGPVFAGIIIAAGLANVAAIRAQQFSGDVAAAPAVPVFGANPNTSIPSVQPLSPALSQQAAPQAKQDLTITFVGAQSVGDALVTSPEEIRKVMQAMADQGGYGVNVTVQTSPS